MQKTIYIKDADLPIFEQAEQIAGESLSAVIVKALKSFINEAEDKLSGFEKHEIKQYTSNSNAYKTGRTVKFTGRKIAEADTKGQGAATAYTAYLTKAGKIVISIEHDNRWEGATSYVKVIQFAGIEELKSEQNHNLPECLVIEIEEAVGIDAAIHID